jgi:hypothetical protein
MKMSAIRTQVVKFPLSVFWVVAGAALAGLGTFIDQSKFPPVAIGKALLLVGVSLCFIPAFLRASDAAPRLNVSRTTVWAMLSVAVVVMIAIGVLLEMQSPA